MIATGKKRKVARNQKKAKHLEDGGLENLRSHKSEVKNPASEILRKKTNAVGLTK